jgi:hypothetical protein
MLIVQPQSQDPKVLKHFILTFQEENPRVIRIVINDDKNIPLASNGAYPMSYQDGNEASIRMTRMFHSHV